MSNRKPKYEIELGRDRGLTRRQLLKGCALLGAGALSARFGLPSIARAMAPDNTRRFIFCYFGGGWDQLMFLDPRDPDANNGQFADTNRLNTLTEPGYAQLEGYNGFQGKVIKAGNLTFGPATVKPNYPGPKLTDFADKIAIVRGINMGTLGHEIGYRYFLTAQFPIGSNPRGSNMSVEIVGQMKPDVPIPALCLQIEAYNQRYEGKYTPVSVNSLQDLLLVLGRDVSLTERDMVEDLLTKFAADTPPCAVQIYDNHKLLSGMRSAQTVTSTLFAQKLAEKFQFATGSDAGSQAIRAQYGLSAGDAYSPGARAAFAAQTIKQQVAQCVSMNMGVGLDTHGTNNRGHADNIYPGIHAMASLIDDLSRSDAPPELQAKGGSKWIDHTTILAFSEFSRTPMFNINGGRDHHLSSSCMIAGAGIAGNQVIGQSSDIGMGVGRYDLLKSQVVPDGGDNIRPENILATLLVSCGLQNQITGIRAEPLRKLLLNA